MCPVTQSCLTLCDAMDYASPGSSVHGIFQARVLEWVATSYSGVSSWPRDQIHISCISCIGRQILYHSCHLGSPNFPFIVAVQLCSHVWLFVTSWTATRPRLPCPSWSSGLCASSCPLSQWCHPTISSSVIPFTSCLQSFPASGFPFSIN